MVRNGMKKIKGTTATKRKASKRVLKVKDVEIIPELYPRGKTSWQTAYDYAESMKAGANFPPIAVAIYQGKFVLMDGAHRIEATKVIKGEYIEAEIFSGLTKNQIYEEAIKRNIHHGRQFSPYEKRLIVVKLKDMGYALNRISEFVQIPLGKLNDFTYGKITNSFTSGKDIVLKSSIGNMADSENIDEDINEIQKSFNAISQENLVSQLNIILENGLLDLNNVNLVVKLKTLKKLLNKVVINKQGEVKQNGKIRKN